MDYRPLEDQQRQELLAALRDNLANDRAILIDPHDTSFAGTADEVAEEQVLSAIKGIPCHY
jgi:hypothetical protein